jgi:hypothetical protein
LEHIRFKEGEDTEDHYPVSLIYIQSPESLGLVRALGATIENGCFAIAILCHALTDHPDSESTFDRVWPILQAFQKHIEDEGYYTPD